MHTYTHVQSTQNRMHNNTYMILPGNALIWSRNHELYELHAALGPFVHVHCLYTGAPMQTYQ